MDTNLSLDILFVAEARWEGGTSPALVAEIQAADRAGIRTGLMMVKCLLLRTSVPTHADIAALIDKGTVALVDPSMPVEVGLVVIHHPIIMGYRPTRRLRIAARAVVLVLHHPAINAVGDEQYDIGPVVANCITAFGQDIILAPVSGVVRDSLPKRLPPRSSLSGEDWTNLIDLGEWPARVSRQPANPVSIGRHARPDILKWPDTREEALLAYPDDAARYRIRILGGGAFLREAYDPIPRNWEVEPFSWDGVSAFLQQLDFYVYFHSTAWSEAFGRTIMEAMATELVVILPPLFEPLFGAAAVYCEPVRVAEVIAGFVEDPAGYKAQARRARCFIAEHFGVEQFTKRLHRLFPWFMSGERAPHISPGAFLSEERILFISSNGIGLGHLTQQMAVAKRLPKEFTPIFATMSQGMRIAHDAGYLTQYLPYYAYIGVGSERWNEVLAGELFELIAFTRPRVVAFDGIVPFDGLIKALAAYPDILRAWVRIGFSPAANAHALAKSHYFDAVIEPGELADDFDHGPTKPFQEQVFRVPPVLHIDPAARRPRQEARDAFGFSPNDLVVAMQLGSGVNYDMRAIRRSLIDEILTYPDTIVLDIRSPLALESTKDDDVHPRVRKIALYPAFQESLAFDAAVSAAGYNGFHEQIFGAIPTLFVPNEAPEMDLQVARALYAELNGLGYRFRRDHDRYRLKEKVAELLDPVARAEVAARCRALPYSNGANQIARFMSDHARLLRTDYDVTKVH
jgi:hypothetical protein